MTQKLGVLLLVRIKSTASRQNTSTQLNSSTRNCSITQLDTYFMDGNGDGVRSGGRKVPRLSVVVCQLDEEKTIVQNAYGENGGA